MTSNAAKPASATSHGHRRVAVLTAEIEDVDAVDLAQGALGAVTVIDGGKAARFITDFVDRLENFDEGLVQLKAKSNPRGKK